MDQLSLVTQTKKRSRSMLRFLLVFICHDHCHDRSHARSRIFTCSTAAIFLCSIQRLDEVCSAGIRPTEYTRQTPDILPTEHTSRQPPDSRLAGHSMWPGSDSSCALDAAIFPTGADAAVPFKTHCGCRSHSKYHCVDLVYIQNIVADACATKNAVCADTCSPKNTIVTKLLALFAIECQKTVYFLKTGY